jgi:hypothetical protein
MRCKKGSAIVGAIWILAVLSILIATYAVDAQLQTRINLYLQERVKVDHLTDAGIAIAEVIMLDYQNVSVPSSTGSDGSSTTASQSEIDEYLEKDRWYWEKVDLKDNRECSTGAVPVDALNPEGGTVTVKIKPIESQWNINNLYPQGDANYAKIWEAVLAASGVPEDYWDSIVDSWCDWRDTDDGDTGEYGAETGTFYKEAYDDYINGRDVEKNKNYLPASRDGEISDLDDLMHIKGFNEYEEEPISAQALLDGGILNPLAKKEDQIEVKGFRKYFTVFGSGKINANIAEKDILVTVPGIWQPSGTSSNHAFNENDVSNATDIADAIVEIRATGNQRDNAGQSMEDDVGTFKNWNDLQNRVQEAVGGGNYIQQEAEQFLSYAPDKFFEVSITGESLGITHTVKAIAIMQDSKIRYIRWQEDP